MRVPDLVEEEGDLSPCLLHLLVDSFSSEPEWRSVPASVDYGLRREHGRWTGDADRREATAGMEAALNDLVEVAVVERDGDVARLTGFGSVVVDAWLRKQRFG